MGASDRLPSLCLKLRVNMAQQIFGCGLPVENLVVWGKVRITMLNSPYIVTGQSKLPGFIKIKRCETGGLAPVPLEFRGHSKWHWAFVLPLEPDLKWQQKRNLNRIT